MPASHPEKSLFGSLAGYERAIMLVDVAGDQEGAVGIGAAPISTVGTSKMSAASRAATSFWIASFVGTSTLPPMCPRFLADAS